MNREQELERWAASRDLCLAWHAEESALDCHASGVEIAFWQQVYDEFSKGWQVTRKEATTDDQGS